MKPESRWLRWVPAALLVLAAVPASAQERPRIDVRAEARTSVNVTVYNNYLALVREVREAELPRGVAAVRFLDVAAQIRPETVYVGALEPAGAFTVLEQNYKYDLLSPARLMELYVDRDLTIVTQNPATGEDRRRNARLLSAADYNYVYRTDEGVTFGLGGRVVLPEVPPNFVERPTLEWLVEARQAGRRAVETSYLTGGMSWNADYVLVLSDDGADAGLTGWVTLRNDSGIGFTGANLQLVAGQVNLVPQTQTVYAPAAMPYGAVAETRGPYRPQFVEEGMFEYHLYTLQRPTDLANREQKQIELFSAERIPVAREYRLHGDSYYYVSQYAAPMEDLPVNVWITFDNTEANHMGMPLPAGTVRVYQTDSRGAQQFVGEDAIDHTPREEDVELRVGRAFDVVAERRQTDYEVLSGSVYETEWEIRIRNRKPDAITVEVREPMAGDWEMLESSHRYESESSRQVLFNVPVRPDEEAILTYRVRTRY
jgi:hypothetical protein